ncbi:MAG TPA: TonB-dependent siderophore receptor, partial [Allosphingosinicella sp.]
MFFRTASLLALGCALAAPAHAADVPAPAEKAPDTGDQTIVVTGQREEYGVKSTRTGTRTDTEIKDIPQAMTVISEAQIEDQALRS